jgi:UDP-N-acetylmuramoyl-L-alanyl-D-glutamate--2,6-diaminopimelate ligase
MVQVLATARQMVDGARVIVVFGCGGDRDRGKRPLMGAAARAGADLVVVTSDNPRGEPPEGVIEDILSGMDRAGVHVEVDRRAAIGAALDLAEPGDLIVIAGRGHETVQQIGGRRLPFDDRIVVAEEARRRPSRDGEAPSGGVGA